MINDKNITLYAFLNIDNPMVAWEVAIGRVKSINDHMNIPARNPAPVRLKEITEF